MIKRTWWRLLGWHESASIGQRFRIIVQALHCDQDHLNEMTDWGWFDHVAKQCERRGKAEAFREAARWVERYPDRAPAMLRDTADTIEKVSDKIRREYVSSPRW